MSLPALQPQGLGGQPSASDPGRDLGEGRITPCRRIVFKGRKSAFIGGAQLIQRNVIGGAQHPVPDHGEDMVRVLLTG